jgi:excisionase family DNA binding protein
MSTNSTHTPLTIAFDEALALIGISRNTLYALVKKGKIPGARKLGSTWRFHREVLLEWLRGAQRTT